MTVSPRRPICLNQKAGQQKKGLHTDSFSSLQDKAMIRLGMSTVTKQIIRTTILFSYLFRDIVSQKQVFLETIRDKSQNFYNWSWEGWRQQHNVESKLLNSNAAHIQYSRWFMGVTWSSNFGSSACGVKCLNVTINAIIGRCMVCTFCCYYELGPWLHLCKYRQVL